MKKLFALLMAVLMIATMAACSKQEEEETRGKDDDKVNTSVVIGEDIFYFESITSDTVRITGFESTNDEAHTVAIPAYLFLDADQQSDPKAVVSIASEAFSRISCISEIVFPTAADYLNGPLSFDIAQPGFEIQAYAFRNCDALRSVTIPAYVKTLGDAAFYDCGLLSSLTFESGCSLTKINPSVFMECDALTSVELPASIETVERGAFFGCDALETVTLAEGTVTILAQAYQNCTSLTTVNLPASLLYIASNSLAGSERLTTVNYTGTSEEVLRYIDDLNLPQE